MEKRVKQETCRLLTGEHCPLEAVIHFLQTISNQ